jgi:hypothetical protein
LNECQAIAVEIDIQTAGMRHASLFTDIVGYNLIMRKDEVMMVNAIEKHISVLEEYTGKYKLTLH